MSCFCCADVNGRIGERGEPTKIWRWFKAAFTGAGEGALNKAAILGINWRCNRPAAGQFP